jgi:hypothetical protein
MANILAQVIRPPLKKERKKTAGVTVLSKSLGKPTKVLGDPSEGGRPTDEIRWPSQPLKAGFLSLPVCTRVCVPFQVNATLSVKPKIKTAVDDQKFLQTRHNFKHGSFVISTSFHEWEKINIKV